MSGRKAALYSIYESKTDEPVAICLPAYECGLALFSRWHRLPPKDKLKVEHKFWEAKYRYLHGGSGRWIIIEEEDDDEECLE